MSAREMERVFGEKGEERDTQKFINLIFFQGYQVMVYVTKIQSPLILMCIYVRAQDQGNETTL